MASYKIHSIFLVLILIQTAFTNSLDDTSQSDDSSEEQMRRTATPSQQLFIYAFEYFVPLGQHFAKSAVNVSRVILKDESLVGNTKPEVVEFKKNLTTFVEKYDTAMGHIYTQDILDFYYNTTYYYEIPAEKATTESTFILSILNKYNCKDVLKKFAEEFIGFKNNFVKMFEAKKSSLEKPLLDWYKKYNTLTNFEEKFDTFSQFLELA